MSREGYLSVTANPSTLLLFDQFTRALGITKTAAITDMLEIYMLSRDEKLYLRLKRELLNVDAAKQLLEQRASNIKIEPKQSFNALWVRWKEFKDDDGDLLLPEQIFESYQRVLYKNGYCCLGLRGPSSGTGFSKEKAEHLRSLLEEWGRVPLIISVGQDLRYIGWFDEFFFDSKPFLISDPEAIPSEFANEPNLIWLRMRSLRRMTEDEVTAEQIFFVPKKNSEPRSLADVLLKKNGGQVPFGYVCLPEPYLSE